MPAPPTVTNSPTPPASPADGDLWFNSTTGRTFNWYISPSTMVGAWVEVEPTGTSVTPHISPHVPPIVPSAGPFDVTRTPTMTMSQVPPLVPPPLPADEWWNTISGELFIYYDDGNTQQWVLASPGKGPMGPPGPPGPISEIAAGSGIILTPDPIVGTGVVAVDFSIVATHADITSALSGFLPLTGGTLTGDLTIAAGHALTTPWVNHDAPTSPGWSISQTGSLVDHRNWQMQPTTPDGDSLVLSAANDAWADTKKWRFFRPDGAFQVGENAGPASWLGQGWLSMWAADTVGIDFQNLANAANKQRWQMSPPTDANGPFYVQALNDDWSVQQTWSFARDGSFNVPGALTALGPLTVGSNTVLAHRLNGNNDSTLGVYSDTANEVIVEAWKTSAPATKYALFWNKYGGVTKTGGDFITHHIVVNDTAPANADTGLSVFNFGADNDLVGLFAWNRNIGANVVARWEMATGTANSYIEYKLHDANSAPFVWAQTGAAVVAHFWDVAAYHFRSQTGTPYFDIATAAINARVPLEVNSTDGTIAFKVIGSTKAARLYSIAGGFGMALEAADQTFSTFQPLFLGGSQVSISIGGNEKWTFDPTFNFVPHVDAALDIGDATHRPRDLTISRNAVIGGTLAVTGVATGLTPTPGDNTTKFATTAFVQTALTGFAPLASPTFTGDPKAPTPAPGDNDTSIATTAFVVAGFAPLASPTFTGDPKAPTPATSDNDTSIATTAYVKAQPGNGGWSLISKQVLGATAASITVDWTAGAYTAILVIANFINTTTNVLVQCRIRKASVTATDSNYELATSYSNNAIGANAAASSAAAQSAWNFGAPTVDANLRNGIAVTMLFPNVIPSGFVKAVGQFMLDNAAGTLTNQSVNFGFRYIGTAGVPMNGITFFPASSTFAAGTTVQVLGLV
jgi:hypothetical protein